MKKLLEITNQILQEEYPESFPLLELLIGTNTCVDKIHDKIFVCITLRYNFNNEVIKCFLFKSFYTVYYEDTINEHITNYTRKAFLRILLFGVGPLSITNLLIGKEFPDESMLMPA